MLIVSRALANSYSTMCSLIEERGQEGQITNNQFYSKLDEGERSEIDIALGQFSTLPSARIHTLLNTLKDKNAGFLQKVSAVRELSNQPTLSEDTRLTLEAALQDGTPSVIMEAAITLSKHRKLPDNGIRILMDLLKLKISAVTDRNEADEMREVRKAHAAWGLGQQQRLSTLVRSVLEAALKDNYKNVKFRAAVALSTHNMLPDADIPILLDALNNKSRMMFKSTFDGLMKYHCEDVGPTAAWALGKRPTLLKASRSALEIALQDEDENVRFEAAIALAAFNILPDTHIKILMNAVKDERFSVVRKVRAIRVLGKSPTLSRAGRPVLEAALLDIHEEVRFEAAIILGRHKVLPEPSGIRILLNAVKNKSCSNETRRARAAMVLSEPPTLSQNIRLALRDKNEERRVKAAIVLNKSNRLSNADTYILLDILQNKNSRVDRGSAAWKLLKQYTPPELQNLLLKTILEDEDLIRSHTAWILGEQPVLSDEVCSALKAALRDDYYGVRLQAAAALGKHKKMHDAEMLILHDTFNTPSEREALSALNRELGILPALPLKDKQLELPKDIRLALQDNDPDRRVRATLALHKQNELPEAGQQILVDAVANKNGPYTTEYRRDAARVLGGESTLSAPALTALENALQDSHADMRARAAVSLHKHQELSKAGQQILVNAVANQDGPYLAVSRCDAAWALGQQTLPLSASARTALENALQDNDTDIRVQAAVALHQHHELPKAGQQILVDAVANKNGPYREGHRRSAARTLARQTTLSESARIALEAALQDNNVNMRALVAVALHKHHKLPEAGQQNLIDAVGNKNGPYLIACRQEATWTLGEQTTLSESACTALEAALQDNDADIRVLAAISLNSHRKLPAAGYPVLVDAVANKNGPYKAEYRRDAAWVLGEQSTLSAPAHTALENALQDSDADMRAQATITLHKHHELPKDIRPALQNKGKEVQVQTAPVLNSSMPLNPARKVLLDTLKDKKYQPSIRAKAAAALGNQPIQSNDVIYSALKAILQDEYEDKELQAQAALSLGKYHLFPSESRDILLNAALDQSFSPEMRTIAAAILAMQPGLPVAMYSDLEGYLEEMDSSKAIRLGAGIALRKYNAVADTGIPVLPDVVENKSEKSSAISSDSIAQVSDEESEEIQPYQLVQWA